MKHCVEVAHAARDRAAREGTVQLAQACAELGEEPHMMRNVKPHKPASRPINGTNTQQGHLDAKARQKLGQELRRMYTAFQELKIPDRLAHLLYELRTRTAGKK